MQIIDAVGKACPQPVILTKKALENMKEGLLTVIVDNPISRDNVERFAKSRKCEVSIQEKENLFHLDISKTVGCEILPFEEGENKVSEHMTTVIYIASDQVGTGAEELGHILMRAFIKTIKDLKHKPEKMIFINSGVKVTTDGSKVIPELKELEDAGIEIFSCGTCLDYYGLKDNLLVGKISNMFEILSFLAEAHRIIRP